MTRSWVSLPLEIVQLIFGQVENSSDLAQCQLTYKTWTNTAKEKLYESVNISKESQSNLSLQSISNSSEHLGQRLMFLKIGSRVLPSLDSTMKPYFELCPNAQVFTYNTRIIYLYHWESVFNQVIKGKWKLPNDILSPPEYSGFEKYINVVLDRKDVMKSLILWSTTKKNHHISRN